MRRSGFALLKMVVMMMLALAIVCSTKTYAFADGTSTVTGSGTNSGSDDSIIDMIKSSDGTGSLNSIKQIVAKLSSSLISLILMTVVAVASVVAAIALLVMIAGGQRGKEDAKGKIVMAAICIVIAVPSTFFSILGFVEKVGTEASNDFNTTNDGAVDDTSKIEIEEPEEYSVRL
jgi:hypothetical protein